MKFSKHVLKNGLRVLTIPMESSESATLNIWVKTGSRNEDKKVNGISHFLEHMVFKGSKKYPSQSDIFHNFDSMGADHNAGTSKEWTNFWAKLPVSDVERGFDMLSDVVLNPLLRTSDLEKERRVIFEEMKLNEDTPMRKIVDVFEEVIFDQNPLAWDIIGETQTMNAIKRGDFLKYRDTGYFSQNMLVSVAGGVNERKVLNLIKRYFSHIPSKKGLLTPKPYNSTQKSPQFKLKSKKTDQAHFILGFKADGRNYSGRFPQNLLSVILGASSSSRLWDEVREKRGLAYAVGGSLERYSDIGYFGVYVGSDINKSYEAIKVILDQCYGIAQNKFKITKKEFAKAKGFIKGRLALALEDSTTVNDFFSEQELFDSEVITPEQVFKKLDAVSVDEIYTEARRLFVPEKLNLAVIGPYKDEKKFVELIR
jgi:predicted Zn-dependent peptidase